jgi:hypothetical protein
MTLQFINERVDIYQLPTADIKQTDVTIGDLHGNAMKLIFMLIKHGIVSGINQNDYAKLVKIYTTPTEALSADDLKQFDSILNKMRFDRKATLRLIGDELADRGENDYFTLKILEKLHDHKVPFEIMLSNHSIEFIEAYEKQTAFHVQMLDPEDHAPSMEKLQQLIDRQLVSRQEVLDMTNKAYKPALCAIAYVLDVSKATPEITIYSHAGIGLNNICALAEKLGVTYQDTSAHALAKVIDQINKQFQAHVKNNTVHTLYTREKMIAGYHNQSELLNDAPFEFIMWNRCYDHVERPTTHCDYHINFVHGHDKRDATQNNVYNLDNDLGKYDQNTGSYTALIALDNMLPIANPVDLPRETHLLLAESQTSNAPIGMMVLSGFITAIGITAIALSFALLNLATFGTLGLIVAGAGLAATLTGVGLFSYAINQFKPTDKPHAEAKLPIHTHACAT